MQFQNTIYSTIKNVKYQGINQTEIIQDHYIENYKTLSREIKKKETKEKEWKRKKEEGEERINVL